MTRTAISSATDTSSTGPGDEDLWGDLGDDAPFVEEALRAVFKHSVTIKGLGLRQPKSGQMIWLKFGVVSRVLLAFPSIIASPSRIVAGSNHAVLIVAIYSSCVADSWTIYY